MGDLRKFLVVLDYEKVHTVEVEGDDMFMDGDALNIDYKELNIFKSPYHRVVYVLDITEE